MPRSFDDESSILLEAHLQRELSGAWAAGRVEWALPGSAASYPPDVRFVDEPGHTLPKAGSAVLPKLLQAESGLHPDPGSPNIG